MPRKKPNPKPEPTTIFTFNDLHWNRIKWACLRNGARDVATAIQERLKSADLSWKIEMSVKLSTCHAIYEACYLGNEPLGKPFLVVASSYAFPKKMDDGTVDAETMEMVKEEIK